MISNMTSKERILNSFEYKSIDYIPCSLMKFFNLSLKCKNQEEFIKKEIELGLDAFVNVGKLNHSVDQTVNSRFWTEVRNGNKYFYRSFETPEGPLTQTVIQKDNWPSEEDFPIFNDLIVTRSQEVLIKPEKDLKKLKYLLGPFKKEDIEKLKEESKIADKIAKEYNLMQVGGNLGFIDYGSSRGFASYQIVGEDLMAWLSGYENVMELSVLKPEIIKEYADIINDWNIRQIEIYLDVTNADLIIRRAWYETTEFWTPKAYKNIIAPTIKREVDLVHQAGKKYGYIITSAFLPILDYILETGVDVLIGLDPKEGKGTDIKRVKEKFLEKKKALWGGVSGSMSIELGNKEETKNAVIYALESLSKNGGFILSPVDNIREETKNVWENTYEFIKVWKKYKKDFI